MTTPVYDVIRIDAFHEHSTNITHYQVNASNLLVYYEREQDDMI